MKPKTLMLFLLIVITLVGLSGCSQNPLNICGGGKIFTNYWDNEEAGWVLTNGIDAVQDVQTERQFDNPVMSPDGNQVVYRELPNRLYLLDLRTRKTEPLIADLSSTALVGGWSPDSQQVLISYGTEIQFFAYTIDIERKIPRQLPAENTFEFSHDWSKDGRYIVLVGTDYLFQGVTDKSVVIERPDGTDHRVVLQDRHTRDVQFLPDSHKIFVVSGKLSGVYLFDWERNEKTELPGLPTDAHKYTLSPNGECIAFVPERRPEPHEEIPIYVLDTGRTFTIPLPAHRYDGITWGK